MSRFEFRVDALPSDVFELTASFLTGFDLLRLSHVTQRLLTELLAPNAQEWRRRVSAGRFDKGAVTAKAQYFAAKSVRFSGRELGKKPKHGRAGAVELWNDGMPQYWHDDSFSIDMWFALLPGEDGVHVGGVILGAQPVTWEYDWWADNHQQFILVDNLRNLYCTVTNVKSVVASNLQLHRWYHLALTFDRASGDLNLPTQRVYLNGELVQETTGQLHSEAHQLWYGQLGSGCISGGSHGKPTDDFCGWYGFNGILDGCRLWRGVLSPDQARRVAQGQLPDTSDCEEGKAVVVWELLAGESAVSGWAARVRCTRPLEGVCTELRKISI